MQDGLQGAFQSGMWLGLGEPGLKLSDADQGHRHTFPYYQAVWQSCIPLPTTFLSSQSLLLLHRQLQINSRKTAFQLSCSFVFKLKHPNLQRLSMPQELKELRALHAKEPQQHFFSSDILVLKEEDTYIFCIFYCPFFWWWFVWLWDFFVCLFFINFYIHK